MINALFHAGNAAARGREWRRQDRERRAVERLVAPRIARILRGVVAAVAGGAAVRSAAARGARAVAAVLRRHARAMQQAAVASAGASAPKGHRCVQELKARTRWDAFLESYEGHILQTAVGITTTAAARARAALVSALEEGLGQREAARAVQQSVGGMAARQAQTVARTEMHTVQQESLLAYAGEVDEDVPLDKTWLAVQDDRVRESHAAADGQTVPAAGTFQVGEAELGCPGDRSGPPEEIINCRCGMAFGPKGN